METQRRQAEFRFSSEPGRRSWYRKPSRFHPPGAAQQAEIKISPLQNQLLVLQGLVKRVKAETGQRINQRVESGQADLDQAQFFKITVKTVRLRIQGNTVVPGKI